MKNSSSQLTASDFSSWEQLENDNQLDLTIKAVLSKLRFIPGRKIASRDLG